MTTRDTGTQHKLRMPPELKEKLFESAKNMNRSLNAEIVARLEQSLNLWPETHPINMSPQELEERAAQPIPKEVINDVIDLFVKKLEDNNFTIVKKNQEK